MIGSIVEYLFAPDDPEAVIEKMADPATRIVSLTVTEGGYNFHHVTGEFDADEPRRAGRPRSRAPRRRPRSAWSPRRWSAGATAGCRRSRSCPATTSRATATSRGGCFTAFARLRGPATLGRLGAAASVRVPELDGRPDHPGHHRRRPGRGRRAVRHRRRLAGGVRAVHPVGAGGHVHRSAGPPFEDVGVQVVDDVEPYELMKLRLLNASHQALCYFGYLAGYRLVHEVGPGPAVRDVPARLHGRARRRRRCSRCPASTWTPTSTS